MTALVVFTVSTLHFEGLCYNLIRGLLLHAEEIYIRVLARSHDAAGAARLEQLEHEQIQNPSSSPLLVLDRPARPEIFDRRPLHLPRLSRDSLECV
jgi:hypothetical protein